MPAALLRPGVGRIREIDGRQTARTRYYLLSLLLEPERFLHVTRAHGAIENGLHWVLDVTMNEDQARNRMENGPENLAILRRIALNPGSGPGQALARA